MYTKGQIRVSVVPEKNTSRLEGAGMPSFGSKVTEKGLAVLNAVIFSKYCLHMFGAKRRPVFNSLA